MTTSRHGNIPGVIWHEGSPTSAYLEQLQAWGINDYTLVSFICHDRRCVVVAGILAAYDAIERMADDDDEDQHP